MKWFFCFCTALGMKRTCFKAQATNKLKLNNLLWTGEHIHPGQRARHPVHEVVAQDLEVGPARVGADVRVPARVLDGAVVGLAVVRLVLHVHSVFEVLGHEAKVHQVDVVLLGAAVAQEEVLGLDVIVDVAL